MLKKNHLNPLILTNSGTSLTSAKKSIGLGKVHLLSTAFVLQKVDNRNSVVLSKLTGRIVFSE